MPEVDPQFIEPQNQNQKVQEIIPKSDRKNFNIMLFIIIIMLIIMIYLVVR